MARSKASISDADSVERGNVSNATRDDLSAVGATPASGKRNASPDALFDQLRAPVIAPDPEEPDTLTNVKRSAKVFKTALSQLLCILQERPMTVSIRQEEGPPQLVTVEKMDVDALPDGITRARVTNKLDSCPETLDNPQVLNLIRASRSLLQTSTRVALELDQEEEVLMAEYVSRQRRA